MWGEKVKNVEHRQPIKSLRTEVIHRHCAPKEMTMVEREVALRACGNANAYSLSSVKFGRPAPEKV